MHRNHPDVHTAGLADDCPGCDEVAKNPFANADTPLLQSLLELAVDRERLSKYRSENEGVASAAILTALERAGKLCETDPWTVAAYLRDRWRVDASILPTHQRRRLKTSYSPGGRN